MDEERRRYYRYPPTAGSEAVVLRLREVACTATLVNFSAEGFRLDMSVESTVEIGDVANLETATGNHHVRVVNVCRDNGVLQVGLQRLVDLQGAEFADGGELAISNPAGDPRQRLIDLLSSPKVWLGLPLALGAAFLLVVGVLRWTSGAKSATSAPHAKSSSNDAASQQTRAEIGERRSASQKKKQTANPAKESVARTREARPDGEFGKKGASAVPGKSSGQQSAGDFASPKSNVEEVARRQGSENAETADPNQEPAFNPKVEATIEINAALKTANRENKHVLLEFGTNECDGCTQLHDIFKKNPEVSAILARSFVLVPVDIGTNRRVFERYVRGEERPNLPFLTILGPDGRVLRNQRTDDLEDGSKHDMAKLKAFLQQWSSAS